jgi:hypothetical protein
MDLCAALRLEPALTVVMRTRNTRKTRANRRSIPHLYRLLPRLLFALSQAVNAS